MVRQKYSPKRDIPCAIRETRSFSVKRICKWVFYKYKKNISNGSVYMWFNHNADKIKELKKELSKPITFYHKGRHISFRLRKDSVEEGLYNHLFYTNRNRKNKHKVTMIQIINLAKEQSSFEGQIETFIQNLMDSELKGQSLVNKIFRLAVERYDLLVKHGEEEKIVITPKKRKKKVDSKTKDKKKPIEIPNKEMQFQTELKEMREDIMRLKTGFKEMGANVMGQVKEQLKTRFEVIREDTIQREKSITQPENVSDSEYNLINNLIPFEVRDKVDIEYVSDKVIIRFVKRIDRDVFMKITGNFRSIGGKYIPDEKDKRWEIPLKNNEQIKTICKEGGEISPHNPTFIKCPLIGGKYRAIKECENLDNSKPCIYYITI